MQQLSGLDASFLYFETPNAPMHIGGVAIYDQSTAPGGRVTFKSILRNIEERLHLSRCFRQRLAFVPLNLDHPYWIEGDNFDLEFHVRHIALPHPGDWRQLCIQVARLHARPLDQARPLWEMYVIEGLDNIPGLPKGSYALVSKIHHAAIDGVSGAEIVAALHDLAPDRKPPPPRKPWRPEAEPVALDLLARSLGHTVRQPFRLAQLLARTAPAVARVGLGLGSEARRLKSAGPVPRTRFNGIVSPHRVFEGRSFDLNAVRAIKNSVEGATVNDAILAICGGALRKYLEDKDELPAESLIAMAPISVRTREQQGTAGNQVSQMSVAVGSDIADPMERLLAVHEGTVSSKELTNAIGAHLMTDYSEFIPSSVAGLAARLYTRLGLANRINPLFNTVITNIPGPQVPLYWNRARLVTNYGLAPILDGMGIIHPVFSYCGQITIAVTACRAMMPDPAFYAQCLQDSFDDMVLATGAKKTAKKSRATPAQAAREKKTPRKRRRARKTAAKRSARARS